MKKWLIEEKNKREEIINKLFCNPIGEKERKEIERLNIECDLLLKIIFKINRGEK